MPSPLFVPINVNTLCVGQPDTTAARDALEAMADFSVLPSTDPDTGVWHQKGPYLGATATERAIPFQSETTFAKGIHLHWDLPEALTVGTVSDGVIGFPAVPNRWLVNRIVIANAETQAALLSTTSWVVESDFVTLERAQDHQTTMAWDFHGGPDEGDPDTPPFRYMGRVRPLDGWAEDPDADFFGDLSAIGYGESAFAAYYPNCRTVFGFHDTLEDVPNYDPSTAQIIYQVVGWFSQAIDDPLDAGFTPEECPLNWTWEGGSADSTLCYGLISGIHYDESNRYLDDSSSTPDVAIGNTLAESVSALLAEQLGDSSLEPFLNAFQLGWLDKLGMEPDAMAGFDEAQHAAQFGGLDGHLIWQVREKRDSDTETDSADVEEQITLPENLGIELNVLNQNQMQLNQLAETLNGQQAMLFADWFRYLILAYQSSVNQRNVDINWVREMIQTRLAEVQATQKNLSPQASLAVEISSQVQQLEADLGDDFELVATAGPRYWQPTNPVVLLSGSDTELPSRDRQLLSMDGDGKLICRLQTTDMLTIPGGILSGSTSVGITAGHVPLPSVTGGFPWFADIFRDVVLTSPSTSGYLTTLAAAQGSSANPAIMDFSATQAWIEAAAEGLAKGETDVGGAVWDGDVPEPVALNAWSGTPWIPFMIQWRLNFDPAFLNRKDVRGNEGARYPSDFITSNFALNDSQVDLEYQGASLESLQQYHGSAILTPNAFVSLANQLSTLAEGGDSEEIKEVLEQIASVHTLAQELTGTNRGFLCLEETLQMKVDDPLMSPGLVETFLEPIQDAIAGLTLLSPDMGANFNPIRSGLLTFDKLRLVDAFGRFRDYDAPNTIVASSLKPPTSLTSAPDHSAFLPPRLAQPSRLLFRWVDADSGVVETNSHPATSPIFGWVVGNHLDSSLAIYDPDGNALGSLQVNSAGTSLIWQSAPGDNKTFGEDLATVFGGENAALRNFANGLWNGGDPTFFAPFLQAVAAAETRIEPQIAQRDPGLAVLVGNPLALARASLTFDLQGSPAQNLSWHSFYDAVNATKEGNQLPVDGASLPYVDFPVQLGNLDKLSDGLVGFWLNPSSEADYRDFFTVATAGDPSAGVTPAQPDTITENLSNSGASQTRLSLLLDPRAPIHATTGVLPVKAITIPPDQYQDALSRLNITFLTTPILGPATNWTIPLPSEMGETTWEWVSHGDSTWETKALSDQLNQTATLDYTPQQIREGWLRTGEPTEPNE